MKLTISEILDISSSLDYLGQKEDVLCAYQIAKNINKVKEHVKKYSHDNRQLIDKYVLKGEDGAYRLNANKSEYEFGINLIKYNEEEYKLKETKVDVELHLIKREDLKDSEGKKIIPPAVVLANLDEVILVDELTA